MPFKSFRRPVSILFSAALVGIPILGKDLGCEVPTLVSTGGPVPQNSHTLAIRWTGYSNFELAYNGQIVLLDAYFDRGSTYPPLGFKASDVKKADVILIGHGHHDHMSDAATVGARTGAVVVGAPITTDKLRSQNLDAKQIRTVTGRGGELLKFGKFEVEPILARHGEPPPNVTRAFNQALRSVTTPFTPEEIATEAAVRANGTSDRRIPAEGTIAYLITLDDGFRIMYRDSGGEITDYERTAMQRVGRVDVALAAVAADVLDSLTSKRALEYMRTYKPDVYIPAHHDADRNDMWRPTEPIFQALKNENPSLVTISKQYREPTCFNTEDNIQRRERKSTSKSATKRQ
jgi:L-ascorbate metabolism protein UlaG (beta-lactamase superfamily)